MTVIRLLVRPAARVSNPCDGDAGRERFDSDMRCGGCGVHHVRAAYHAAGVHDGAFVRERGTVPWFARGADSRLCHTDTEL
jgi:hypothetical protein